MANCPEKINDLSWHGEDFMFPGCLITGNNCLAGRSHSSNNIKAFVIVITVIVEFWSTKAVWCVASKLLLIGTNQSFPNHIYAGKYCNFVLSNING